MKFSMCPICEQVDGRMGPQRLQQCGNSHTGHTDLALKSALYDLLALKSLANKTFLASIKPFRSLASLAVT